MRSIVLLSAALTAVFAFDAHAVNLVPNNSFESYVSCPTGFSQFFQTVAWTTPTAGTSDLYNACAPTGFPSVSVPYNTFGQQAARTGVGYAGVIVYSAAPGYREYVEAPLTSPLVASNTYYVEFWLSLSDTVDTAIDRMGAYLSVGSVGPQAYNTALPFTPQVESPAATFLTDKVNWIKVSGTFVAAGGEDHIVIGNFHDDANTATTPAGGTWPGTNYYVDDVLVELQAPTDQACCTPDGLCSMMLPGECLAIGGTPLGVGVNCDAGPCGVVAAKKTTWGAIKSVYR